EGHGQVLADVAVGPRLTVVAAHHQHLDRASARVAAEVEDPDLTGVELAGTPEWDAAQLPPPLRLAPDPLGVHREAPHARQLDGGELAAVDAARVETHRVGVELEPADRVMPEEDALGAEPSRRPGDALLESAGAFAVRTDGAEV